VKPVRTKASNMVYGGPPGVADLHCERVKPGAIASVWWLTPAERAAIAKGANVRLIVLTEPVPPVGLEVVMDSGIGEDDPAVLARLERVREGRL
jgi:hypothetical protein